MKRLENRIGGQQPQENAVQISSDLRRVKEDACARWQRSGGDWLSNPPLDQSLMGMPSRPGLAMLCASRVLGS